MDESKDIDGVLSMKDRIFAIAINSGAFTVDEVRSIMGLRPYGDELGLPPREGA